MNDQDVFKQHMQDMADELAATERSPVMSEEKYHNIRQLLLNKDKKVHPQFKHWVKIKKFQIMDMPDLGIAEALVIPNRQKNPGATSSLFLIVVPASSIWGIITEIHTEEFNHGGYKKLMNHVAERYYGITRVYVQTYCNLCPVCRQNKAIQPYSERRTATRFMQKVDFDLIDMQQSPDDGHHFIGHLKDRFTGYNIIFPLTQDDSEELAFKLEAHVFGYFGMPHVFHCNMVGQVTDQLTIVLCRRWGINTISSDNPQERFQDSLKRKIEDMKEMEGFSFNETVFPWVSWLPCIMYSLNNEHQNANGKPPNAAVFGKVFQKPSTKALNFSDSLCSQEESEPKHTAQTESATHKPNVKSKKQLLDLPNVKLQVVLSKTSRKTTKRLVHDKAPLINFDTEAPANTTKQRSCKRYRSKVVVECGD